MNLSEFIIHISKILFFQKLNTFDVSLVFLGGLSSFYFL